MFAILVGCNPNNKSPTPPIVTKELPKRPKYISIGGVIFDQMDYNPIDTSLILYQYKENTPLILNTIITMNSPHMGLKMARGIIKFLSKVLIQL